MDPLEISAARAPWLDLRRSGGVPRSSSGRFGAVLLDLDGCLVDSNDAHARAWSDALARFGRNVPASRIRRHI